MPRGGDVVEKKIEDIVVNMMRQLSQPGASYRQLQLTANLDGTEPRLGYTNTAAGLEKLARDMAALAKVYELSKTNATATKRDVFYDDKMIYETQRRADSAITNVCELLDVERQKIRITSSSKAFLRGELTFIDDEAKTIDARAAAIPISESLVEYRPISSALFILVIEKDATFQRLIDAGYFNVFPHSILMTGRGYPDLCSRKVLRFLGDRLAIPIFGLFDADVHGLSIYLSYKYGSGKWHVESSGVAVPKIQWLGLGFSDLDNLPIPEDQYLPIKFAEKKRLRQLIHRATQINEPVIVKEAEKMLETGKKVELEVLTGGAGLGSRYIVTDYLRRKLYNYLPCTSQGESARSSSAASGSQRSLPTDSQKYF
ncbi:unnamed protein product, partial [Mesorhabditis spiculigera]